MELSPQAAPAAPPPRDWLDTALFVLLWVLIIGVLLAGVALALSVYQGRQEAQLSAPAARIIEDLKANVRVYPNSAPLRVRLGEAYAASGLTAQAVAEFNNALKIQPKHTGALLDLGTVAMRQGDQQAARGYFQKVIDLSGGGNPNQANSQLESAYFGLGVLDVQTRDYQDGIGLLKAALRINQTASDSYFWLAMGFKGLGDTDAELEQLKYAILFDPNYAEANYEIAMIYLNRKDYVDAANHLMVAQKRAPKAQPVQDALQSLGSAQDWQQKSAAAQAKGDFVSAIEDAKVASILAPDNTALAIAAAKLIDSKGKAADALAAWQAVLKLDPANTEAKAAVVRLKAATSKPKKQ